MRAQFMYVVHVIPLIRGTRVEKLSYFSSEKYEIGTLIEVPIRGKSYHAMVTHTVAVTTAKSSVRSASFTLRKLPPQKNPVTLPESLRATAEALTGYYPSTTGALLFQLLPPDIRSGAHKYPRGGAHIHDEDTTPQILTARSDERWLSYHSHIRSVFAHRGSVLFVAPNTVTAEYAAVKLSQGIEDRLTLLTSTQTKRQREQSYRDFTDTSRARLLVTTPSFAYLDRVDLLSIIVEQSGSNHYVGRTRPYLDHRVVLATYAKVSGRSIIFGDTVPPTTLEEGRRSERYITYGNDVKRIAFPAPLKTIKQRDHSTPEHPFALFSPQLLQTIARTLEGRGRVFLYGARRGLAPVVTCIDCGHLFRCPDSHTPYSLLRTYKEGVEERWFVSSTSGRRIRAADTCPLCGSWRLRERGIGIQHIYDEWLKEGPSSTVILFDETTARTPKQAAALIEQFYSERSSVLIGTSMALPYLTTPVALSSIISFDAARAVPSWRTDELIFRLLLELREKSTQEVIMQTRQESDDVVTFASRGALERFFDDELLLRSQLQYPPFVTLILLTWVATPAALSISDTLRTVFAAYTPHCYRSPQSSEGTPTMHALMRIPQAEKTTYATLLPLLRELPPFVKIEINPDRIV